ncbi:MAG: hypothetical protein RSE18_00160 [Acinetobacter sp.]
MAYRAPNRGTPPTGIGGDTYDSSADKLFANTFELFTYLGCDPETGILPDAFPVSRGGTGGNSIEQARQSLGVYSKEDTDTKLAQVVQSTANSIAEVNAKVKPITEGGTGATTAAEALLALGTYSAAEIDTKTAQATASVRGTVSLATNAETLAGTDATKSVTPASFLSALRKLVNVAEMTPHDVTAQRAFNTTYYNARDVPMRIHVGFRMPAGANANIEVGGRAQGFVTKLSAGGEEFYTLIGFVNPQQSYRFNIIGGTPFIQLCEEYYVE